MTDIYIYIKLNKNKQTYLEITVNSDPNRPPLAALEGLGDATAVPTRSRAVATSLLACHFLGWEKLFATKNC